MESTLILFCVDKRKMSSEVDPGFWRQVAQFAAMPLGVLFTLVWAMLNHRIAKVEKKADDSITRIEFERAVADSKLHDERLRVDIRDLYGKSEATKELINQRVSDAKDQLSEKLDRLREDMNGGFTRILQERSRKE